MGTKDLRHAYLILAHDSFKILKILISALDDERNDIYIHFDAKVTKLPFLPVKHAKLFVLDDRINVHWGDVSMLEAEFNLFEAASKSKKYAYYHLISGVDFPIKSQNYIHSFFERNLGKEFIGFNPVVGEPQIGMKVRRYHLFSDDFRSRPGYIFKIKNLIRSVFLKIQKSIKLKRNEHVEFRKGTQWVSITDSFLSYALSKKKETLKLYENTFCPDEIFLQTLCWNSAFRDQVFSFDNEGLSCMREVRWTNNTIVDWTISDFEELKVSNKLFARKFNHTSESLLLKICDQLLRNT